MRNITTIVFIIICIWLFACKKTTTAPTAVVTPPSTPTSGHKIKYIIYADPTIIKLTGAYTDSAGNMIAVNQGFSRCTLDTFNASTDTAYDYVGSPLHVLGNYQIKIGEVATGKSAYIRLTGGNKSGLFFSVAIAKDTVVSGRTVWLAKTYKVLHNPSAGTIELSYLVE